MQYLINTVTDFEYIKFKIQPNRLCKSYSNILCASTHFLQNTVQLRDRFFKCGHCLMINVAIFVAFRLGTRRDIRASPKQLTNPC